MVSLPSPPASPPPSPIKPGADAAVASSSLIFASFCTRGMPTWLEFYDPSDNKWHRIGPIPGIADDQSLKGFSMVSLGDSVYIAGGRLCRKSPEAFDDDDTDVEVDLLVRSDVVRYSVTDDEWAVCTPMTVPRFDFACAACDGKMYVAGGRCGLSRGRGTSAGEVYDPAQDRWEPLPSMSLLRYKCAGVAWRGRFHVVGGFAEREDAGGRMTMQSAVERCSAEVYNAELGEWEVMAGMWQLDVPPNQIVAVEGRRLFSSGDCLNTWKGHIEAYDGKLNIWNIVDWSHMHDLSSLLLAPSNSLSSSFDGSPRSLQRKYLTMAPIGTRLFFLAGYRLPGLASRYLSVAHMFDTMATTDEAAWRSLEAVQVDEDKELCAHCCVVQT